MQARNCWISDLGGHRRACGPRSQEHSIGTVCQGIEDQEARQIQRTLLASQLFSAMPPLEAAKVIVSIMMSVGWWSKGKLLKLRHDDISRAHFQGSITGTAARRTHGAEMYPETPPQIFHVKSTTQIGRESGRKRLVASSNRAHMDFMVTENGKAKDECKLVKFRTLRYREDVCIKCGRISNSRTSFGKCAYLAAHRGTGRSRMGALNRRTASRSNTRLHRLCPMRKGSRRTTRAATYKAMPRPFAEEHNSVGHEERSSHHKQKSKTESDAVPKQWRLRRDCWSLWSH